MSLIAAWGSLLCGLSGMMLAWCAVVARRGSLDARSAWYAGFSACGSELSPLLLLGAMVLATAATTMGASDSPVGRVGLALHGLAAAGLLLAWWRARVAGAAVERVLQQALGAGYAARIRPERQALLHSIPALSGWLRPFHYTLPGVEYLRDMPYASDAHPLQRLDILRPAAIYPAARPMPVLINFHGGAWLFGAKGTQAMPLLMHLAQNGWLVIDANYRLSPEVRMPEHLIDAKRVIAWTRQHAAAYGGNPDFIAITGGSAGGHLCALAALTPNQAQWQPGFETADTQVQLALPFYGKYDLTEQAATDPVFAQFMADKVMPGPKASHAALWQAMDPACHVTPQAPPFLILHGSHDSLIGVEEARWFADRLRATSTQAVLFAEIPGAQHAWDVVHSARCHLTAGPIQRFLEYQYSQFLPSAANSAPAAVITPLHEKSHVPTI